MPCKKLLLSIIWVLFSISGFAQQPDAFIRNTDYRSAIDFYDHSSFSGANNLFKKVVSDEIPENINLPLEDERLIKINSRFYASLGDLKLNQLNADKSLLELVKEYPYAPFSQSVNFHLGTYYFDNYDFIRASTSLEKADPNSLSPDQNDQLNFDLGYSYLILNRNEEADSRFSKVISHQGPYLEDGLYYSGHLAFVKKDYKLALARFSVLNQKGRYADIYPIYVNQIKLIQGKYNEVILSGDSILKSGKSPHQAELNRLIGSAYFFKRDFNKASGYFNKFKQDSASIIETSQNHYQIGYTYYKLGQIDKAIRELRFLYSLQDAYAQNGLYILGLCYLKNNQRVESRDAFKLASGIPGDDLVTEYALLYYSKLSFELGFKKEAIQSSKIFVKNYPNSPNNSEIKILEGELLLDSKNYPEAYKVLKNIPKRDIKGELIFQKASYFYGLEQYNSDHFPEAAQLLKESADHPQDKGILALAHFWEGECLYELRDYNQGINFYQKYFSETEPKTSTVYAEALYGEGYCYFKKENYGKALSLFERSNLVTQKNENLRIDASARMADCYFMLKQYGKAKSLYAQNTNSSTKESDYSLFQSANIQGLQNNLPGKIHSLQSILSNYPNSNYAGKAQFEIAQSYLSLGQTDQAILEYKKIISLYPTSPSVPKAQLNIGLIYFNNNQDDEALVQYKKVVSLYPGTPESKSALASIKNIFIQRGDAAGFLAYAGTLGNSAISQNAQDSITYDSGNKQFLHGNYQASIQLFALYFEKFPSGNFILPAHYNHAKALEKLGRNDDAKLDFEYLAQQIPKNKYSEEAMVKVAALEYKNKNYSGSIPILQNLSNSAQTTENYGYAIEGLMNAYSGLGNVDSTLFYAGKIKLFTKSTPYQLEEAGLQGGKAYLIKGDTLSAENYLQPVIKNSKSVNGAEARYTEAQIHFSRGDFKGSQKILFDLIKKLPNYNYWVGKSFVLLSDNYMALGDVFQAKSTLQSVVDHYAENDDVKKLAVDKLAKLQNKP